MTTIDWVKEQWKAGKTDQAIITELEKGNWKRFQAQRLLERAYRERIFSPGMAAWLTCGLLICIPLIVFLTRDTLMRIGVPVILILSYGLGTFGGIRLARKAFTIVSTCLVGVGAWFLFMTLGVRLPLAFPQQHTIPTWWFILVAGVSFALAVYAMESVFHGIRMRLEGAGPKNSKRVWFWSSVIGVLVAITLFVLYAWMTVQISDAMPRVQETYDEALARYDREGDLISGIENPALRRIVEQHHQEMLDTRDARFPSVLAATFNDAGVPAYCAYTSQGFLQSVQMGLDLAMADAFGGYHARGLPEPENLEARYAELSDTGSCFSNEIIDGAGVRTITGEPAVFLLLATRLRPANDLVGCMQVIGIDVCRMRTNPLGQLDLSNPDERELAAFLVWQHDQQVQEELLQFGLRS